MKTNLPSFENNHSKYKAVLVYGNDYGLVSVTTDKILNKLAAADRNVFNYTHLLYDAVLKNPDLLYDECNSISFTGERKVVYISEVEKTLPPWLKELLLQPKQDLYIVLRAGELAPSSAIRKFFESEEGLAVIVCYHDQALTIENIIKDHLAKSGLTIEKPALAYLVENMGADRLVTMAEIDKLLVFGQGKTQINLADVRNLTSHHVDLALDDFCLNVISGNLRNFDNEQQFILDSKNNVITVIRAILRYYHQMLKVKILQEQGVSFEAALTKLIPPVFFKHLPAFTASCKKLSIASIEEKIREYGELELQCKTTNIEHRLLFERMVIQSL